MKRKLVLGLAILSLIPMIGCQRLQRLPDMIAKSTGLSSESPSSPITTASSGSSIGNSQLQARSMVVGGQNRSYYLYAPRSVQPGQAAPMLIAFHGGGGGATQFAERMSLVSMAERYGMVLVLPQGEGRPGGGRKGKGGSWNANSISPQGYAENNGINDIGFVDALLNTVPGTYSVDRSRIYAVGFSKGGMMAYRAACVLRGQITAIAAVSATLSSSDCPNPEGVSLLHIHGTNDQNVPLNGGAGSGTGAKGNWPPVSRGLDYFTTGNQCSTQPNITRPASDTTCSTRTCNGNEKVQLCLVDGGGHAWPGAQPAKWQINRNVYVSQNFDATDYIARFLLSQ